ncbi:MAG: hypothetical protein R6U50_08895, partial [Desulfobacterales bacterium]
MNSKARILSSLSKAQLLDISRSLGYRGFIVLNKAEIVDQLASDKGITLRDILQTLKLSELKTVSRSLGIDTIALKKGQVVEKIIYNIDELIPEPKKEPKAKMKHTMNNSNGSNQELEKKLWQAADQLRDDSEDPCYFQDNILWSRPSIKLAGK